MVIIWQIFSLYIVYSENNTIIPTLAILKYVSRRDFYVSSSSEMTYECEEWLWSLEKHLFGWNASSQVRKRISMP